MVGFRKLYFLTMEMFTLYLIASEKIYFEIQKLNNTL